MSNEISELHAIWASAKTGRPRHSQYRADLYLPNTDPPLMAAAGYLATLAYGDDSQKHADLVEAIMSYMAKARRDLLGKRDTPMKWLRLPTKKMIGRLRKAQNKIWFERFPCATAATQLAITRISKGQAIQLHGPQTVKGLATIYAKQIGRSEDNFMRYWSESKPVLHLAKAFLDYVEKLPSGPDGRRMNLERFVSKDSTWVFPAVSQSKVVEVALLRAGIATKGDLISLHRKGDLISLRRS